MRPIRVSLVARVSGGDRTGWGELGSVSQAWSLSVSIVRPQHSAVGEVPLEPRRVTGGVGEGAGSSQQPDPPSASVRTALGNWNGGAAVVIL